jgi:hypothetical protein
MITYHKQVPRVWLWAFVAVAVALVLAWALGAFDPASDAGESAPDTAASASIDQPAAAAALSASQMEGRAQALLDEPELLPDGRPSDIDAEEWAMLKQATVDHPNPKAELERLTKFLRFQRGVEAWQALSDQGDTPERDKLAQKLIESLPAHLVNAEVSMPEALMLCAALLHGDRGEDAGVDQKVEQCKTRLEQSLPPPDKEKLRKEEACRADWEARKAALTSEFLKKSPQERAVEQRQFEAELEAARVAIFSSAGCDGNF